jgi:hypothetical protein
MTSLRASWLHDMGATTVRGDGTTERACYFAG